MELSYLFWDEKVVIIIDGVVIYKNGKEKVGLRRWKNREKGPTKKGTSHG
jgi:hypothetical protein